MHQPVGPAWLVGLETSGVAGAMRQWLWLYPMVEIVGGVPITGDGIQHTKNTPRHGRWLDRLCLDHGGVAELSCTP